LERLKQIFTWLITWLTPKRSQDVKVVGLCLLVAATFWFLNALNRDYSTRISYPIRFNFDDSTYISVTPLPTKLRLSVTGYGWTLLKKSLSIDSEPIEYTISKPLRTKYITAPFLLTAVSEQLQGLRINYVVEDTLQMSFDRRVQKTVPLKIDSAKVNLNKNYVIAEAIYLNPSKVTLEGPASLLDKIGQAYVIPVLTQDIDDDFDERLEIPNPDIALVNMDVKKVEVRFKLEALISDSRKVMVRISHFPAHKDSINLQRMVKVTYSIRQRDAPKVNPGDFSIVADFNDIKTQDSTIVLFIEKQPHFIRNVSLDNPYIKVKNGQ
jgi:hypothetical protein